MYPGNGTLTSEFIASNLPRSKLDAITPSKKNNCCHYFICQFATLLIYQFITKTLNIH